MVVAHLFQTPTQNEHNHNIVAAAVAKLDFFQ